MRRTQLYLDEDLWNVLHAQACSRKTTVSELVREAIRERYFGKQEQRTKAMQEFVGIRKNFSEPTDAVEYVRTQRAGDRLNGLYKRMISSSRWPESSRSSEAVLFSPVSVAELRAGARPSEYEVTNSLFKALRCVPIDEAVMISALRADS